MGRYDVYPNPSGLDYLLDVQADILQQMSTRMVMPLLPLSKAPNPRKRSIRSSTSRGNCT